jgi:uncharacterized membrane protein
MNGALKDRIEKNRRLMTYNFAGFVVLRLVGKGVVLALSTAPAVKFVAALFIIASVICLVAAAVNVHRLAKALDGFESLSIQVDRRLRFEAP